MFPSLIVGLKVLLVVGALVLAGVEVFKSRGGSALAWAVFMLALALALR